MANVTISGQELHDMICVAAAFLEKNKKAIDALNVFPVPDGDTGINMSLTLQTAAREVRDGKKGDGRPGRFGTGAGFAKGCARQQRRNPKPDLPRLWQGPAG